MDYVMRFRGKIVTNEKLRSLLPKIAPKSFFRKTCFRSIFTKQPPFTYLQGQTNYVAHFEAKLPRTKTSLAFA
jgi:hypothetical protein